MQENGLPGRVCLLAGAHPLSGLRCLYYEEKAQEACAVPVPPYVDAVTEAVYKALYTRCAVHAHALGIDAVKYDKLIQCIARTLITGFK